MCKRFQLMVVCFCVILTVAQAGPSGHYVNGVEGLKAASLPPPGRYYRMYNVYYTADTLRNDDGDKMDIGFKVKVFANVHRLIWVSDIEVLGGNLFMDALVPLLYTDLKIEAMGLADDRWGVGDPFIEPLGITWHGPQYDAAVSAGVYLPVGSYSRDEPASAGKDMTTLMLTAGGTVYFDAGKTWAASLLSRFETHTHQDRRDIRPGNSFHFEYGLSKTFNRVLDIGLAGYAHWQVSDAGGADLMLDGSARSDRNRVFAVGPEINYFIPRHVLFVSVRGLTEFAARGQPEGALAVVTLTKPF